MAGIKKRGIQSEQSKRYYKGQEVKPTRYVYSSGRSVMAGKIAETDEVIAAFLLDMADYVGVADEDFDKVLANAE